MDLPFPLTTTTHLTRKKLNQMRIASGTVMRTAAEHPEQILGLIVGMHNRYRQVVLIVGESDYFVVPVFPWVSGTASPIVEFYRNGRTVIKTFASRLDRDRWFGAYQTCVRVGKDRHIYL